MVTLSMSQRKETQFEEGTGRRCEDKKLEEAGKEGISTFASPMTDHLLGQNSSQEAVAAEGIKRTLGDSGSKSEAVVYCLLRLFASHEFSNIFSNFQVLSV